MYTIYFLLLLLHKNLMSTTCTELYARLAHTCNLRSISRQMIDFVRRLGESPVNPHQQQTDHKKMPSWLSQTLLSPIYFFLASSAKKWKHGHIEPFLKIYCLKADLSRIYLARFQDMFKRKKIKLH